jgi:hypothetical protein
VSFVNKAPELWYTKTPWCGSCIRSHTRVLILYYICAWLKYVKVLNQHIAMFKFLFIPIERWLKGCGVAKLVAHSPTVRRSTVWVWMPTNFSLEHCLLKLLTDDKYQIIYVFDMGLILQITLIQAYVIKVCLHINLSILEATSKLY